MLTHCYPDLFLLASTVWAAPSPPRGILIPTFVENHGEPGGRSVLKPRGGSGWLYPKCVRYTWPEVAELIDQAGLVGAYVRRKDRHRQQWLVAGLGEGRVRRVTEALEK